LTSFVHTDAFPLLGEHAAASCASCHAGQEFAATPKQCADCHRADDAHGGRNGTQCGACHSAVGWPVTSFDHARLTGFALRGAHGSLSCESCHVESLAAALPSTCAGCHGADDPHGGRLGSDCGACHASTTWQTTRFDHAEATGFALAGAHAAVGCTSCHAAGVEAELGRECASCHGEDPHRGQLGARCESCHSQESWHAPLRFDHDLGAFPLLGKHAALECGQCHGSLAFHDAGATCAECHSADDPHGGAFGAACATCHNPVDWRAWTFDHATQTGFALTGAHSVLTCASCHGGGRAGGGQTAFAAAPACAECHRQDDPHGGRFGADCASCHSTDSFGEVRRR
jgi:hypothetical protein